MQTIQRLVSSGHCFWTSDQIEASKLERLIAKWQPRFQSRADTAARAYGKSAGRASVHLMVHPKYKLRSRMPHRTHPLWQSTGGRSRRWARGICSQSMRRRIDLSNRKLRIQFKGLPIGQLFTHPIRGRARQPAGFLIAAP